MTEWILTEGASLQRPADPDDGQGKPQNGLYAQQQMEGNDKSNKNCTSS